ncbi:membrane protein insertase YidC [Actinosynnema sp. NPDC047251]|uniref:Membrane protein insertase YidC n=1 Tax=Saccharothrix espanaensis (strain ATCC 51144 / DSM 44229 / JCM 9112 / NBRC 15066 / NRRL 15764) TaxID=1179773 RepID=K0JV40_SACES|nr:membrane protein insertase YidC [Saccharothrix espanaensis]CCH28614.1 Inner membrane insertion protein [Saccharothrix espanaensis DSM 44229]
MFYDLGSALAGVATPALAIVAFTALVRLLMHPLSRAAVRGEKARAALAPEMRVIQEKYRKDPRKLQEKTLELYRGNGTSMFAGCLPTLVQAPFFMVMYRLVSTPNPLLDGTLFGTSLGTHWFGVYEHNAVFLTLFAVLTAVAFATSRRQAAVAARTGGPQPPFAKVLRLLPFGTVVISAVLPLAAGIYLLTTTTWTLMERAYLYRAVQLPPRAGTPARSRRT